MRATAALRGATGGAPGVLTVQTTVADHLPTDQEHDADGQKPEGDKAPALIHDPEK
jgi:hypothetical protein